MSIYLSNAQDQLKRIDHLIYVSLKYTRTVDVLKSILKRLIACFDECISGLLELSVDREKIPEIPTNVVARMRTIIELFSHPEIEKLLNFYVMLRKIDKETPIKSNEYRRGVRMSVILKDTVVEVDIDNVEEYFKLAQSFFRICLKIFEVTNETGQDPDLESVIRGVAIDLEFERG